MSKLDDMIAEENRLCGATRMLRLLSENSVFSPEVQQAIRLEGMKLLSEPRAFDLSTTAASTKNARLEEQAVNDFLHDRNRGAI